MTCKDCLHIEPCYGHPIEELTNEANGICEPDVEKRCEWFKDKSKIVELPYKIGDTVYVLEYEDDRPVDYSGYIFIMANNYFAFLSPTINGEDNPIEICNEFYQRSLDYRDNSGIIVPIAEIFTKEEAEARLKELQDGN